MKSAFQKILLTGLVFAPLPLLAQSAGAQQSTSFNPVLIGLLSIIIVLTAAIAILAHVYLQLAYVYRDKMNKERNAGGTAKAIALLLAAGLCSVKAFAQEATDKAASAAAEAAAPVSPYISGIPRMDFYALVTIIGFELLFIAVFLGMIYRMVRILRNVPESAPIALPQFLGKISRKLTNAVALDKEETIVLQHDYDGIRELDNSLPPWWKWGFVMTIVFSFVYMWYYHVSDGPNQIQEYTAAVERAEIEKAAFMAKAGASVDENTVTLILDKGELSDAGALFKNTCAACHREDGGGAVGPNLTDNYWLHGGALKDVFKSIKYGWKDKGMPEWGHNMSAKQIAGLASYIKNMTGKNVAGGKAPQGDLMVEGGDRAIDSVSNKTEPRLTPATEKLNKDNPLMALKDTTKGKG